MNLDLISFLTKDFNFNSIHYNHGRFWILISIQILREGIRENDYYRLEQPIVLGKLGIQVLGTLSSEGLVNSWRRSLVSPGDDYHNWERSV